MNKTQPSKLFPHAAAAALCLPILFACGFAQAQTTTNFTAAGTNSWTCPSGVTSVQVEAWGGGGGGGGCLNSAGVSEYVSAGGGAGGSYLRYTVSVAPGTVYNLTVAAGGTAGASTGGTGGAGGSSYFGNTASGNSNGAVVLAVGGPGGAGSSTNFGSQSARIGGIAGGTATTTGNVPTTGATTNVAGTSGGTSVGGAAGTAHSGAGGAGAGFSGSSGGGAGGVAVVNNTSSTAGNNGTAPGGGASGAAILTTSKAGGVGGAGQITLTYTPSIPTAGNSTVSASPGSIPADNSTTSTITVTLKDGSGNPVAGKTVTLASSGTANTISPASGPSTSGGVVTFTVKSALGGSATFTATDTSDSVIVSQTATVTFVALAVDHFTVTPSTGTASAGQVFTAVVQAYNASNAAITDNSVDGTVVTMTGTGLVQFDANADGTYGDTTQALTNGALTINVRDLKAESVTVTATAGTATGTSSSVSITPDAAAQLQLLMPGETATPGVAPGKTGTPTARSAGAGFTVIVNEVDTNWNVAGAGDTVQLTASGDANAILPPNTALSGGTVTLGVTNILAGGGHTLTATDVSSAGITNATSPGYTVVPGPVTQMIILAPGESATLGVAPGKTGSPNGEFSTVGYSVTVKALDAYYNLVTNDTDTIGVLSSDVAATLPANTALAAGTKTLNLTNNTVTTVTLTATNVTQGSSVAVGTTTVVVGENTTATTLASSLNPANQGQSITFTATVTAAGTHTGTVAFKNGGALLGTGTVSGSTATFTTSGGLGTYTISAVYSGDANNLGSASTNLSQVIQLGTAVANPAALMEDGQNYPPGTAPTAGNPPWSINSSSTVIGILAGDLSGATSPDIKPVANNTTNLAAHLILGASVTASREYWRSFNNSNTVSSGSVYFSMLMAAGFNPTNTDEVNMLMQAGGANSPPTGLVDADPVSMHTRNVDAHHYNLGVERLGGTTVWATNILAVSNTYLVVFKYTFGPAGTSDLFINPTPGAAEPTPSASASAGAFTEPANIGTVLFFEGPTPAQTSGTPSILFSSGFNYDVMRADTNWTNATQPVGASPLGLTAVAFSSAPQVLALNTNSSLMTITLEDQASNFVTASSATLVSLSSSSSGGVFLSAVDGVTVITNVTIASGTNSASFYYSDSIAGNPTLAAATGILTPGAQVETINPPAGLLDHFTVTPSLSTTTAGTVFTLTVQAYDSNSVAITDSSLNGSTVTMSSSSSAQFDANGDGTYGDFSKALTNGALTVNVEDNKAESAIFTATLGLSTGTSSAVSITPGTGTRLQVLLPGETAAPGTAQGKTGTPVSEVSGIPFSLVVNLVDTNWNAVSSADTVHITGAGDPGAGLPADTALTAGTVTLAVTNILAGSGYTLSATDISNAGISSGASASYSVLPGAVKQLVLLAPGESATPGIAPGKTGTPNHQNEGFTFNLTVEAYDANYNVATSSGDTVGITSSGSPRAVLPANTALSAGTTTLSIAQFTSGSVTDTASDISAPGVVAGTTTITIDPVPQYKSVQSGSWEDTNTWQISFDGTAWMPATNTPTATNADTISVTNGFTVTVNSNEVIDQTLVSSNSTLAVATGVILSTTKGFGPFDLDVSGTISNAGAVTNKTGGTTGFEPAAIYLHNQDGGPIVLATWDPTSTCDIIGWKVATTVSSATGMRQKFGNFTWDSTNQTSQLSFGSSTPTNFSGNFNVISTGTGALALCVGANISLNIGGSVNVLGGSLYAVTAATSSELETLNIAGDVNVNGGLLNMSEVLTANETVIWNISGNLNIISGTVTATSTTVPPTFRFVKPGVQTLTVGPAASIPAGSTLDWDITSGSTLDLGTNIIPGAGLFTVESGGGLITAHAAGFAGNLTLSGAKSLSTNGNYTYDGLMAQSGDALLPASVSSLTINNSLGVTLSQSELVSNLNLIVNSATMALIASSNSPAPLTVKSGTLSLAGTPVDITILGSALPQGNYLLVDDGAGGAVAGTITNVVDGVLTNFADVTGAGLGAGLLGQLQITNSQLYLDVPAFYAIADDSSGFISGENIWFTNVSGLKMYIWSSTNGSLSVSNWTLEGMMQEQSLSPALPGLSRYSKNVVPTGSPEYYIAAVNNVSPYLSPVPVATITTPDFTTFTVAVTNVGINAAGVLALGTASPPSISSAAVYSGSGFQLQFSGTSGHDYTVQASTNLTTWTNVGTGTFTSSPASFTDTAATNYPKRFYRIVSQ